VCSYDRGGYGWSDPPVNGDRSSAEVTKELHTLLENAGVKPPYILVGHSLGGLNIRVYNGAYPGEVVGAVFVDSSHPDQVQKMTPGMREMFRNSTKSLRQQIRYLPFMIDFGVMRFTEHRDHSLDQYPRDFIDEVNYLQQSVPFTKALLGELEDFDKSAEQARNSGDFGSKPVVVLTAGKEADVPGLSKQDSGDFHRTWVSELQPQLGRLSTNGKQVVVPNSGHMIPFEAPQTVVDAVREVFGGTAVKQSP
ncbi:MAG TPA: alpha/beta hydrolase, partial [Candidatus Koribacter sp.]